jgi:hypothetical protein
VLKSRGMYQAVKRELRIERFMTAEFANRRLREVGGVSRNRLLVDKMIVWRAILGLIVASKWPAPEPQSACRFSTPRARDQRKQTPAMCAPTPRIPRLDFINSAMSMAAACDSAADLPRVTRGRRLHRCDERKVRSCTLRIILWQLFLAVEILLLPSRWRP